MSSPATLSSTIVQLLRHQGGALSSAELQAQLRVSQPTVSRALAPLIQSGEVQKVGAARTQRLLEAYGVLIANTDRPLQPPCPSGPRPRRWPAASGRQRRRMCASPPAFAACVPRTSRTSASDAAFYVGFCIFKLLRAEQFACAMLRPMLCQPCPHSSCALARTAGVRSMNPPLPSITTISTTAT